MASRGRGRGRGRGGYGGGYGGGRGNPEPFILFPDVVLPDINDIKEEMALVVSNNKLQNYWKSSPYYLEKPTKIIEENDIERYSDRNKAKTRSKRVSLQVHLKLDDRYFPSELFAGKKIKQYDQSKGFSFHSKGADEKFNLLEKEERESKDEESKDVNKKKTDDDETDNESDPEIDESSSEESDDDYRKFDPVDDDEDGVNDEEDDNPDDDKVY